LSGNPNQNSCNEFYGGNNDGESGGIGACYLAQGVGYSLENMTRSATSFCYLQNIPSAPEGVSLVSGQYPDDDPLKLFAPPDGTDSRIVKVTVSGMQGEPESLENDSQDVYIEIFAKDTNSANGDIYKHIIYFCQGNQSNPDDYEQAIIKNNLNYQGYNLGGQGQGTHEVLVTGKLTYEAGQVVFDGNAKRTAEISFINDQNDFFKSVLEIANNKIKNKTYDNFGSDTRRGYSSTRYSGSDVSSIRFIEGGMKDDNFQVVTEYRDSYYAAALDNNEFNGDLNSVNLNTDPFYEGQTSIDTSILTTFDCAAEPDVAISMDFNNQVLQEFVAECENHSVSNMNFCNDNSEVQQAQQQYENVCGGPN